MGTGSCRGGEAAGEWPWPPIPSSAEVKERVDQYIYYPSGPSSPVVGWPLPSPLTNPKISGQYVNFRDLFLQNLYSTLSQTIIYCEHKSVFIRLSLGNKNRRLARRSSPPVRQSVCVAYAVSRIFMHLGAWVLYNSSHKYGLLEKSTKWQLHLLNGVHKSVPITFHISWPICVTSGIEDLRTMTVRNYEIRENRCSESHIWT
jgi:hypothetical protein